jgi:hypothetical protein
LKPLLEELVSNRHDGHAQRSDACEFTVPL